MGGPEWEDADFTGDPGDPFFPDWWDVDLRGYERPQWFAQGRLPTTQRYLLARITGRRLATGLWWRRLRFDQWIRCRSSLTASLVTALLGLAAPRSPLAQGSAAEAGVTGLRGSLHTAARAAIVCVRGAMRAARHTLAHGIAVVRARVTWFIGLAARKLAASGRALALLVRGGSWRTAVLTVFPRRLAGVARTPDQEGLVLVAELAAAGWNSSAAREAVSSIVAASRLNPAIAHELAGAGGDGQAGSLKARLVHALEEASASAELEETIGKIADEALDHPLTPTFRTYFPGREPPFTRDDYATYLPTWPPGRNCSITTTSSRAIQRPDHSAPADFTLTAYEHGTLREIPFEDSPHAAGSARSATGRRRPSS